MCPLKLKLVRLLTVRVQLLNGHCNTLIHRVKKYYTVSYKKIKVLKLYSFLHVAVWCDLLSKIFSRSILIIIEILEMTAILKRFKVLSIHELDRDFAPKNQFVKRLATITVIHRHTPSNTQTNILVAIHK